MRPGAELIRKSSNNSGTLYQIENYVGLRIESNPKKCRFQYDDRKYIDRGQLYVLQISMAILKQGLEELNHGKVGRPFGFSNACFAAASLLRNATGIKCRQLQGLAEAIVGRVNAPTYSAFQKRMTKLDCTFDEKGSGNTAAAVTVRSHEAKSRNLNRNYSAIHVPYSKHI